MVARVCPQQESQHGVPRHTQDKNSTECCATLRQTQHGVLCHTGLDEAIDEAWIERNVVDL